MSKAIAWRVVLLVAIGVGLFLWIQSSKPAQCPPGTSAKWAQYSGWFCAVDPIKK